MSRISVRRRERGGPPSDQGRHHRRGPRHDQGQRREAGRRRDYAGPATLFQRHADTAATHHGGRLVKLLGDGALLRFPDPIAGVEAALELVETMSGEGLPSAHAGIDAGPVVERDLDVFGRTVNLASRIADAAARGEVLVSSRVARAAKGRTVDLERLKDRSLKGIAEPVPLFRATRASEKSA